VGAGVAWSDMGARSHTWVQKRLHLFWFKVFRCLDRSSGACRSHGGEGGRGEQLQHQAPPAPASSATCCLAGAVAGRWGCENNLHMSWFKRTRQEQLAALHGQSLAGGGGAEGGAGAHAGGGVGAGSSVLGASSSSSGGASFTHSPATALLQCFLADLQATRA